MLKMKIAVLVSGGGTNLQALLDAQSKGILKSGEIVLVVSSKPGVYALERAKKAGVASCVISGDDFEEKLRSQLEQAGVQLIVLAGFLRILSVDFTRDYAGQILNVHPSLIPSFCGKGFYGLRVHEAVLSYGVKVTGATVHFVNEIPDGGEIILQKAVEVKPGDTPETLQRRVMEEAEWKLLPLAAEEVCKRLLETQGGTE